MTNEEIIADERYHTCGRCEWEDIPYMCHQCKWGEDTRKDLWELKYKEQHQEYMQEYLKDVELTLMREKEGGSVNFNTIKQELNKKIKRMSEEDFQKFIKELKRIYYGNKPQESEETK